MLRVCSFLAAALLLSGCFEAKDEIVVGADGSGTIKGSVRVELAKQKQAMLLLGMRFGRKVPLDEKGHPPSPVAPARIRAAAKRTEGLKVVRAEESTKDGIRTTRAELRFQTLEAAARAGAFHTSIVTLKQEERPAGEGKDKSQMLWRLTFKDGPTGHPELGKFDPRALARLLEPQLGTAKFERVLRLPTRVVETNGTVSKDRRVVRWSRDYSQVMKEGEVVLTVLFESAEGLKLEAFHHSPSLGEILRRSIELPSDASDPKDEEPDKPSGKRTEASGG